jgi:hypothetical protein
LSPFRKKNDYQNFVIAQIEQEFEHNLSKFIFQRNVGLLLLPPKRDNPNDAFCRKNENIKDADGLRQAVISDLLKTISEQCGISFYQKWRIVVRLF